MSTWRPAPRLVVEIPLECRGSVRIQAESLEAELPLRIWLRQALIRRQSLTAAITEWLASTEERKAA
jgi:hypothetical protein